MDIICGVKFATELLYMAAIAKILCHAMYLVATGYTDITGTADATSGAG